MFAGQQRIRPDLDRLHEAVKIIAASKKPAADCGANAVIVPNHGGRNLDSTMAPIEVLPEVVNAVGERITVLIDSGFRRGSDVVKALVLSAKAVLIGRATLYGTAVAELNSEYLQLP